MNAAAQAVLKREVRRYYHVPAEAPLDQLGEPVRTWVSYALGTVERGRSALAELDRRYPLAAGFRFLDAGCAYGGFLAAALERGAREVVGVEIDEKLLRIANAFVPALGVEAKIVAGSLGDAELMESLGRFDVVTCADVIEHVADPPRVLELLAARVAPGGALYLAVPNAWSPTWARSDPHFQLFGITLLPPAEARRYYELATGWRQYDVGEFHPLERYERWLRGHGLEPLLLNAPTHGHEVLGQLEKETADLEARAMAFEDPRLPPDLQAGIRAAAMDLAQQVARDLRRFRRLGRWSPAAAASWAELLVRRYGVATWQVLARRPA